MSRKSNLLYVTEFLLPPQQTGQTGGTISNRNFLRALARRHTVTVLSFDQENSAEVFQDEPFSVLNVPAPRWSAIKRFGNWLGFVREQTKSFLDRSEPPSALIATSATLSAFDVAPFSAKTVAIIRAYENFGARCPWVPFKQRLQLTKLAAIRHFQDGRQIRSADAVLTNSAFMQRAIADRFGIEAQTIQVLPQQVDVAPAANTSPSGSVGFVHRGSEKNIKFVLQLAELSPDLQYLVYGHKSDLPARIPDNVRLCGWSGDRNMMFSSASLWLVPSLWAEPFGRVSIEAQAANRAVLVANTGGLPETVFERRFCMDGFEAESWLYRMRQLLKLPAADLKSNGSKVRTAFSHHQHDTRILEAMDDILSYHQEIVHA